MDDKREIFIDGTKLPHHPKRVVKWLMGESIYPLHVEISPSSACNHRCKICCVDYKGHRAKKLSKALLQRLPGQLKETGVGSFVLAGEGEPLLNQNCAEFINSSYKNGIDSAISTNGVFFTPEFSNLTLSSLSWARFSIQAPFKNEYDDIHRGHKDDFEKVLANIRYAVEYKRKNSLPVTLGIQQILVNENWQLVLDEAKLAKSLGVDYFTVKRFSKHKNNTYDVPEDLWKKSIPQFEEAEKLSDSNFKSIIRINQFANQPRTYERCRGIPLISQILADGGVYPCCQFYDDPKFSYGNLNEHSLAEILDSSHARKIKKFIAEKMDISQCMTYCRHNSVNIYLESLLQDKHIAQMARDKDEAGLLKALEPPSKAPTHINFI